MTRTSACIALVAAAVVAIAAMHGAEAAGLRAPAAAPLSSAPEHTPDSADAKLAADQAEAALRQRRMQARANTARLLHPSWSRRVRALGEQTIAHLKVPRDAKAAATARAPRRVQENVRPLDNGYPVEGQVDAYQYAYYSYQLSNPGSGNTQVTFWVSPHGGDADLFVDCQGTTPDKGTHRWSSTQVSGDETVTVEPSDPNSCYDGYVLAVMGFTNSTYTISAQEASFTTLYDSMPLYGMVGNGGSQKYMFETSENSMGYDDVFTLDVTRGDPDLYIACDSFPGPSNYTWSSTGTGTDVITVEAYMGCQDRYYITVYGANVAHDTMTAEYNLDVTENWHGSGSGSGSSGSWHGSGSGSHWGSGSGGSYWGSGSGGSYWGSGSGGSYWGSGSGGSYWGSSSGSYGGGSSGYSGSGSWGGSDDDGSWHGSGSGSGGGWGPGPGGMLPLYYGGQATGGYVGGDDHMYFSVSAMDVQSDGGYVVVTDLDGKGTLYADCSNDGTPGPYGFRWSDDWMPADLPFSIIELDPSMPDACHDPLSYWFSVSSANYSWANFTIGYQAYNEQMYQTPLLEGLPQAGTFKDEQERRYFSYWVEDYGMPGRNVRVELTAWGAPVQLCVIADGNLDTSVPHMNCAWSGVAKGDVGKVDEIRVEFSATDSRMMTDSLYIVVQAPAQADRAYYAVKVYSGYD